MVCAQALGQMTQTVSANSCLKYMSALFLTMLGSSRTCWNLARWL